MQELRFITNETPSLKINDNEEVVEITKEWYDQLLNCVPPLHKTRDFFLVGEPHDHDRVTGVALHTLVFTYRGHYFASRAVACNQTTDQIRDWVQHLIVSFILS